MFREEKIVVIYFRKESPQLANKRSGFFKKIYANMKQMLLNVID